jgi:predicted NAD/FAD-binding protein
MPKNQRAWAAWNYRLEQVKPEMRTTVHYWMNALQSLPSKQNYFVSLDAKTTPSFDQAKSIYHFDYEHPLFDAQSVSAQKILSRLNRSGPVYFCGSYFGYGFHEDGLAAGQILAEHLLKTKYAEQPKQRSPEVQL